MLDSIPDLVFWPLFVVFVFCVSLAFGLAFGKVGKWSDESRKYLDYDPIAERNRRNERNGFKSRTGIR